MKHYKVVAIVQILATRTYYVEADSDEEAKRLPFEYNEPMFSEDPVTVTETNEDQVTLVSIKSVEQIS